MSQKFINNYVFFNKKMAYDCIRSNYVKNKIKGKSFSDEKFKKYIKNLMMIEDYVSGKNNGMFAAMWVHRAIEGRIVREGNRDVFVDLCEPRAKKKIMQEIKNKEGVVINYKEEYEAIRDELDPEWRAEEAERERKQVEERAKQEQKRMEKQRKEREKELKEWLKAGGK